MPVLRYPQFLIGSLPIQEAGGWLARLTEEQSEYNRVSLRSEFRGDPAPGSSLRVGYNNRSPEGGDQGGGETPISPLLVCTQRYATRHLSKKHFTLAGVSDKCTVLRRNGHCFVL